jgi:iron complex outermembrane receptor protein
LVQAVAGTGDGPQGAFRYGGALGAAAYRVSSKVFHHGATQTGAVSAQDGWKNTTSDGRLDWSGGPDRILLQGRFAQVDTTAPTVAPDSGVIFPTAGVRSPYNVGSALGRWTHTWSGGGALETQAFFNTNHLQTDVLGAIENMADLDLQYHTRAYARHDLVVGGGYRHMTFSSHGTFGGLSLSQDRYTGVIANVYAQDEIPVAERLRVTLGSRFEHDSLSGWNAQPTARVLYDLARSQQRVWASASQAVHTPSVFDIGLQTEVELPPAPDGTPMTLSIRGNPNYRPERFIDVEAGYRVSIGTRATIDVATFRGGYNGLPLAHPLAPEFVASPPHLVLPMQIQNLLDATTTGVEISGRWMPAQAFALDASYSALSIVHHRDSASQDQVPAFAGDLSPTQEWQLHPTVLFPRGELSVSLFHVGEIQAIPVSAYTRADVRVEMKLTHELTASVIGHNLSSSLHLESFGSATAFPSTQVPRSVQFQLAWRF